MRLFVAIELPDETRRFLAGLQGGIASARWVDIDDLHLTLCFIGEGDEAGLEDLDSELCGVAFPAFDVAIDGLGTFERRSRVHTLWAGVCLSPALTALHGKIGAAVDRAGYQPEKRKYKPHVTLARFSNRANPETGSYIRDNNMAATGHFTARRFSLFRSHLGQGGARYEVLASYGLLEIV